METWAHQDRLGSTIAVSDDTGTVQEKITYASFGETDAQTGFPFKFTGQRFDPETELYHYKARTYSPTLGRFLQTDPIGYGLDTNLYGYARNNPNSYTDPSGEILDTILDAIFVVYDVAVLAVDEIFNGGANRTENLVALGADVAATATPFVTGAGLGVRATSNLADVAKQVPANKTLEASSSVNQVLLRNQLSAEQIAKGHAFEKHVLDKGEFAGLGIWTRAHFRQHVENVINNPTASRQLSNGRQAFWDDATSTVVIRDPRHLDGGTAFRPDLGRAYFTDILK